MARRRIGIWLVGAKGGVASTATVGLVALQKGLVGSQGLVTQLPRFSGLDLVEWKELVVGGHDIRATSLFDEAMQMHRVSRAIDGQLIEQCRGELDKIDKNIRPGTIFNVGPTIEQF